MGEAAVIARRLADSHEYLGQVVGGLAGEDAALGLPKVTGNDAQNRFESTRALYSQLSEKVRAVIGSAARINAARQAAAALGASGDRVYERFSERSGMPAGGIVGLLSDKRLPMVLLGTGLVTLLLVAGLYALSGNIRKTLELQASRNERNQEAILRLLDELSNLADGDLTVQATVTEDITGAIADSINYAIEALRELVTTINDSAVSLDAAARQTQASAGHLAKAGPQGR